MKNALIIYSSWTGSTQEIAEHIAKTLEKNKFKAKVISAKEKPNLNEFDLIVIGTSVHAGRTLSDFRRFIKQNFEILTSKPIAFFVSCANMMHDTEESREETRAWLEKGIKNFSVLQPLSIGYFGGATKTSGKSFDKLNIFTRRIIQAMEKKMLSEYGKTDFRDWDKIEAWVIDLIQIIN